MEIRTLDGERVRDIPLPGLGTRQGLSGEPDEDVAYFGYSDFTSPPEIFRLEIGSGRTERWSRAEVPVDPSPFVGEQVFFTSRDGTRVPMFVIHRRDITLDGRTPFILNGYGGFSVSMQPEFRGSLYPWLEAGGGYAVANIRGGGEYGEEWHRAGMGANKQNVFDDFIAAAEYLVDHGYTSPSRLAASGGSNGGLLVGAALTQRPDLFAAVICSVPLLDMIRYHRFGAGPFWIDEYGTAERAEDFQWLSAYSPYHRVEPGTRYPAVLFASADSDDRVDPLHARKMAAALQAASGSERPVLFRMERNAGHGGADLVRAQVELNTDIYSFLLSELAVESR
jgi:prolyl oligopeptidase